MATATPWAILLCKFKGNSAEPQPKSFFQKLFCSQGTGIGGMVDYFSDISYKAVDLSGSQVFGWFQLDHTFAQDKMLDRSQRIKKGIEAAQGQVVFEQFYGIVVILNAANIDMGSVGRQQLNLGNGPKTYGLVVLDASPTVWSPSAAGHEMGHGFGLDHSWSAKPDDVVYGDQWDIMSYGNCFTFNGPKFSPSGPGLIAPYLLSQGWLDPNRVTTVVIGNTNSSRTLAALGHPEAKGPLAARLDFVDQQGKALTYMIEYRRADRWDAGFAQDVVVIHEVRSNGLSYLKDALAAGMQYQNDQYGFGVVFEKVDSGAAAAEILIGRNPVVTLDGSVETTSTEVVGQGTYHFPGKKFCPSRDYPYTQKKQSQTASFEASASLLDTKTLQYEWYVDSTKLDPSSHNAVISVTSHSALPAPGGKPTYGYAATIDYSVVGSFVALHNRPEDANYSITLRVIVKDAKGRMASDEVTVEFDGEILAFGNSYYTDMQRCAMKWREYVSKMKTKPKPIPRGGDPGPERGAKRKIAETVHEIVRKQPHLAEDMRKTFGHIPGVGLHSRVRPTKPGANKKKKSKPKRKKNG